MMDSQKPSDGERGASHWLLVRTCSLRCVLKLKKKTVHNHILYVLCYRYLPFLTYLHPGFLPFVFIPLDMYACGYLTGCTARLFCSVVFSSPGISFMPRGTADVPKGNVNSFRLLRWSLRAGNCDVSSRHSWIPRHLFFTFFVPAASLLPKRLYFVFLDPFCKPDLFPPEVDGTCCRAWISRGKVSARYE